MNANQVRPCCWPSRTTLFRVASLAMVVAVVLLVLQGSPGSAQQMTGTLSGLVMDQTGARIPHARIELKNDASGDARSTSSDDVGYFNLTAIQPATYSVTITAKGFATYEVRGIVMGQGDQRTIPNIALKVSATTSEVQIVSTADVVVPVDTAEISTDLNEQMINNIPLGGRNAGELLKIMPGFARTNGMSQAAAFNSTGAVSSNSGPAGDYSANGTQPNGSMAYMLDGSNLIDPGNMGTQIANINQDMVSEVKVLTSSYSSEYAKGPVVFEAFSKSGGAHFHGEGYLYARNSALNSWDWYTKNQFKQQGGGSDLAKNLHPDEHYWYGGGNVGGPVRLPFTGFNKNRDKLFFWFGYEYMNQHPASSPVAMNVPTEAQLNGDFSNNDVSGIMSGLLGSSNAYAYYGMYNPPTANKNAVPTGSWDPNIKGLIASGAYPKPNVTPNSSNSWNNYEYAKSFPQNRWEITSKGTYAFSENTKLNASYSRQEEKDYHPLSIWWAPQWTVPYPSQVSAQAVGNFIMGNLTHVFNPTTTNEFVFNYSRWINPNTLSDPKKVDRTALGFGVGTIFDHGHAISQIPNIDGPWGGALSNISEMPFNGGFNNGKGFGGTKLGYALYDNFTKNIGTHSLKGGFYWDYEGNQQSSSAANNGTVNLGWGANGTGNLVADMLLGRINNYQEANTSPVSQIGFHQWSFYAQDSWKVNPQLTLNYGVRADHEGQWSGGTGNGSFWFGSDGHNNLGFQVWDPASYSNPTKISDPNTAPGNTGLKWHAIDSSVPLSGFKTRFLTLNPRIGFAYDILGDGKTVLRGGYAVFQYQVSTQVNSAWAGPQNSFTYQANGPNQQNGKEMGYAGIGLVKPYSSTTQNGSSISAMQKGDDRNPYTADWNITLSRSLPWRSVFEVSYVGNQSKNLYQDPVNSNLGNLNNIAPGGVFRVNPMSGITRSPNAPACTIDPSKSEDASYGGNSTYCVSDSVHYSSQLPTWSQWDWAPYNAYQNIYLLAHTGYANYHSLQMNWQKQSGPVTWTANYTFSKVLGIWDYDSDNGASAGPNVDSFNLKNNYGPLAYDHTHIINFAYNWNMPNFVRKGSMTLRQAVNGWQISGVTGFQSGAPLQSNTGGNLNASYPGSLSVPYNDTPAPDNSIKLPNGLVATSMTPATWYGTPSQRIITPVITCDPRRGRHDHQYFNPSCFAPPAYGQMGTLVWPYIHLPAWTDTDLALYKSFKVTENQRVEFRMSATNAFNHPLREFNAAGGNADVHLNFAQDITLPGGNNGHQLQALSQTNTNTSTTGAPLAKAGNRSMLFAVKYYF